MNLANDKGYGEGGAGSEFNPFVINIALFFTITGSCISLLSVWLHWKNYRKPNQQRQVIRILWMVPIYGISTFISLISLNTAFYVDTFRDIYEAFVIYTFFNLLLNKLGGERAMIIMLHSRPPSENFFPGTLWSRDIYVGDPYTFLFVKRGILQFVYVKPLLAVVTMVLKATGNYQDGEISWSSSYFYLTFFYNLSVCLSLWCLMVFFYATKKDLAGFRPLPKFLCVKAIIFFSFWQSVIIALLVFFGAIRDDGPEHISVAIQDFLVCVEMVPFAIAHSFAFSYEDYYDVNVHSARMPIFTAIKDSFGLKDVVMDTLDTLRGSKFNYKSFEPSEGVPHIGSSRTSRIMAGLRYSSSTSKKHWLEPAPASKFLSTGRGMNDEVVDEDSEQLAFDDPDPRDSVEELYVASRSMQFGDYNYPVIDFRAPLWRQHRRKQRSAGYGGTSTSATVFSAAESSTRGGRILEQRHSRSPKNAYMPIEQREGCVDVIVERGKGNYVVVDSSSASENEDLTPPLQRHDRRKQKQRSRTPLRHQPQVHVSQSSPPSYLQQTMPLSSTPSTSTFSTTLHPPIPSISRTSLTSSSSSSSAISSPSSSSTTTPHKAPQIQQYSSHTRSPTSRQPHPTRSQQQQQSNRPESYQQWASINTSWDNQQESPGSNIFDYTITNDNNEQDDMFMTSNVWK
ncbi:organic solute transporter Ostalpha-domain-containing protein [Absidia repens]|uniref:Organic solute transporter Ostalpha-domain-containing protein n=1 Tax=Absidia repens TaxID=90262 RepID=A0A1X2IYB4_9FUNG|nr:organic solute transporter Ostalpha-domain-containing protein [Absidia repens]